MKNEYLLNAEELKSKKNKIDSGEPVILEVRENDLLSWRKARVIVSSQAIDGGKATAVLSSVGNISEDKVYIRILEDVDPIIEER